MEQKRPADIIQELLDYLWNGLGLEEKGLVTAYEREAAAGKPRRYYHLTKAGEAALREKETAWHTYADAVGRVLGGGACCAGT